MISEEILEDVATAVKDIMKKKGVEDYTYHIDGQSECGENYMGEVFFLSATPDEDTKKTYHFVMKTAKRSRELREAMPIEVIYNRELFLYSDVFPSYRSLIQEVKPDFEFELVPKVLYIDRTLNKETMVMENLKFEGFKLWNRKKPWNLEHSLLVMKSYGKLHALSMALKDQQPKRFEELEKNLGNVSDAFSGKVDYNKYYIGQLDHIMGLLKNAGRQDLVEKYDGIMEEADRYVFKNGVEEEDKIAICHMDCWNNNFMFRYENEDDQQPSDVRFLDFQLSVLDSPAKDLSYNIYSTCDSSNLAHFDLLLQTYHESLKSTLRTLGSDTSTCVTMEDLRRHWRKYAVYGLFFCITLIKMQLLEKEDAPKIEEMAKHEDMMEGFKVKVTNPEEYDRRIMAVFIHFGDNFL